MEKLTNLQLVKLLKAEVIMLETCLENNIPVDVKPMIEKLELIGSRPSDR